MSIKSKSKTMSSQHSVSPTVPWAALWSGEQETRGLNIARHVHSGKILEEKFLGVTWLPVKENMQGQGEPLFSQLNVVRQVQAQLLGLCHVCGESAAREDHTVGYTLTDSQIVARGAHMIRTYTPPTCDSCHTFSMTQCPHLMASSPSRGWYRARAWGVAGQTYTPDGDGQQFTGSLRLSQEILDKVVGYQLIIQLSLREGEHELQKDHR